MVVNRKSYLNCLHFDYWHGIYCHGKRILYSRRNLPESRTTFRSVPHKNSLKPAFFAIRLLKREGWSDRICVNFYGLFAVEPQISVRIWTQQNFDRKTRRIFWSIFFYSPQETHQKLIKIPVLSTAFWCTLLCHSLHPEQPIAIHRQILPCLYSLPGTVLKAIFLSYKTIKNLDKSFVYSLLISSYTVNFNPTLA